MNFTCSNCDIGWNGSKCSIPQPVLDICSGWLTDAFSSSFNPFRSCDDMAMDYLSACERVTNAGVIRRPTTAFILGLGSFTCSGASIALLNTCIQNGPNGASTPFLKSIPNLCEGFVNPFMSVIANVSGASSNNTRNTSAIMPWPADFTIVFMKVVFNASIKIPINLTYVNSSGVFTQQGTYRSAGSSVTTSFGLNSVKESLLAWDNATCGAVSSLPGQLHGHPLALILQQYFGASLSSFSYVSQGFFTAPLGNATQLSLYYQQDYTGAPVRLGIAQRSTRFLDVTFGPLQTYSQNATFAFPWYCKQ